MHRKTILNKLVRLRSPNDMRPWHVNKTKDTARPQGWRKHVTDVAMATITGRTDRQTDGQSATQLALVTRDLILAFPVTYVAKTRLNLLWSDAVAEDAIVWSTLLSILPSLTDEDDVSAGRRRVLNVLIA